MSHERFPLAERATPCPTCKSTGFDESLLGPDRCSFCDGSYSGVGPTVDDLAFELATLRSQLHELQDALVDSMGTEGGIPMTDRLARAMEACGAL